jgi:hypothetical protein
LKGRWVLNMVLATTTTSPINRPKFYVELVLLALLIFIAADWMGRTFSSLLLNFAVGVAFYPIIALLMPKHWKTADFGADYLGRKRRYVPLAFAVVMTGVSVSFYLNAERDELRGYKWAIMSGVFLWMAASQFVLWLKIRNVSFPNE